MRQRSLVAFTVLGQAAAGMLTALAAVRWVVGAPAGYGAAGRLAGLEPPVPDAWLVEPLVAIGALLLAAGVAAVLHLGSPRNAWRALTGLGSSWLSREVLLAGVFGAMWLLVLVLTVAGVGTPDMRRTLLTAAALPALGMVYAMARVYRLRTVTVWDTVLTTTAFLLTTAVLGSLAAALALVLDVPGLEPAVRGLVWVGMVSALTELILTPATRSHVVQARARTDAGLWGDPPVRWATVGRGALLVAGLVAAAGALFMATVGAGSVGMALVPPTLAGALAATFAAEVVGRAGFYACYARVGT